MNLELSPNAYYSADIENFLHSTSDEILGALSAGSTFSVETTQRDAWIGQIEILKAALACVSGAVFFEFSVPRIGSRIDVVVVAGPALFVVEFKVGQADFHRGDINQVWDYALDLKNFHKGSHQALIIPILVATQAPSGDASLSDPSEDGVFGPVCCAPVDLGRLIDEGLSRFSGVSLSPREWGCSAYQPTPTIIEAAQTLYAKHSVEAISRSDSGARNLKVTSARVEEVVDEARLLGKKAIVFVTGVPGAGKTLVGLNIATRRRDPSSATHAVFLSGNGPLVSVLQEALTRDEYQRLRNTPDRLRKGDIRQKIKAFIQNVHHFRDAGLRDVDPPSDHVVIFDEAQRAWDREMTSQFMIKKKGRAGFAQSEPEFLLSYLDRHPDWAVVICLVGGGQEINRGEAGISAWLDAIQSDFPSWSVYVSSELTDSEYAAGHAIEALTGRANVVMDDDLHLAVSMRSFRAEHVSTFVKAVLDCEFEAAKAAFESISSRYPIVLTRDLNRAKNWIRSRARGSERFGLVASSSAQRLKPYAIDVRVNIDPVHWFLADSNDTRSSYYMEDAATEFQVQGLELDWVCVTWDADLRFTSPGWTYHSFVGSKWNRVHKEDRRQYLLNAYRVLLTRARQGMVVFVPEGSDWDQTRTAAYYDSTYEYLAGLGLPVLN
jgi:hypothetical protein